MSKGVLDNRRVLIVEDQYLIADEMRRTVLALGGHPVGPCASVASARTQIAGKDIDLGLLDVSLRDEDVFPLADELSERQIPIIFATGYDQWMIPRRFGGSRWLQKPVSREALEALLREQPPGAAPLRQV